MHWAIIILIVAVVALLVWTGSSRITIPRKASFEGIEDPEASQAYDRISRWPQFRFLRHMVTRKLADYHPAGTLADIGCGPGYLVTKIAQSHPQLQVLGIDYSDEMIKTARLNASGSGLSDRVSYRRGDVAHLPLEDGTLDFAVSTLSLHHWSDPGGSLTEIYRVLKPDGQLLLFDLRRDPCRAFWWLLHFAQGVVVPVALRRVNEPLGSLQASYTVAEVEALMTGSLFSAHNVTGGLAWFFAWGKKA